MTETGPTARVLRRLGMALVAVAAVTAGACDRAAAPTRDPGSRGPTAAASADGNTTVGAPASTTAPRSIGAAPTAAAPTAAGSPLVEPTRGPAVDEPAGSGPAGSEVTGGEPGSGSTVRLDLPSDAALGEPIEIPITVAVGTGEPTWDGAAVDVEVDGLRAELTDLEASDLAPGATATGTVVLEVTPGSVADPAVGGAKVTLHLLDGDVEVGRRRDTITALAGPDRAWFSHGSEGEARRAMLTDLLASGEITRQQYDAGLTATTESTGQSTVEVIAPSED